MNFRYFSCLCSPWVSCWHRYSLGHSYQMKWMALVAKISIIGLWEGPTFKELWVGSWRWLFLHHHMNPLDISYVFIFGGRLGRSCNLQDSSLKYELMAACYQTTREKQPKINKHCSISWWLFLGKFFLAGFSVHTTAASLKWKVLQVHLLAPVIFQLSLPEDFLAFSLWWK